MIPWKILDTNFCWLMTQIQQHFEYNFDKTPDT